MKILKFNNSEKKCQLCNNNVQFLLVAHTPVAGYKIVSLEESLNQKSFAMNFLFCPACSMLRYEYISEAGVIMDKLYKEHHSTYYFTRKLREYLNGFVEGLIEKYRVSRGSWVLEVGCNDGGLLSLFKEKSGCRVVGVEPAAGFTSSWQKFGIRVINDYFTPGVVKTLTNEKFDLIVIRHVLEHIADPVFFLEQVAELAGPKTQIILEVPYLKTILVKNRIDNIGYSHLNYFTLRSINEIVKKINMGISDYSLEETDGGSIVFHIKKTIRTDPKFLDCIDAGQIEAFLDSIADKKTGLAKRLEKYSPSEIIGYGAGAKGSHLIYILDLHKFITVVVDETPAYRDKFIPGTGIQIKAPEYLYNDFVKGVVNLAPTHSDTIRKKVPQRLDFIDIFNG